MTTAQGPDGPILVDSSADFARTFGAVSQWAGSVEGFFENGGARLWVRRVTGKRGPTAADLAAIFAQPDISVCFFPGLTPPAFQKSVATRLEAQRDRFALFDAPDTADAPPMPGTSYAALFRPWLATPRGPVPPSGHVAGVLVSGDRDRGILHSPGGLPVRGATGLTRSGSQFSIRSFPGRGILVWSARTLSTDPEYKYIPVRRLQIFLAQSISRGLEWVVFEPNTQATWRNVRASVESFLLTVWRSGNLQGARPEEAFFVRCDRTTMTQNDLDNGRLVVLIGFAPLRPAEFVIFRVVKVLQ